MQWAAYSAGSGVCQAFSATAYIQIPAIFLDRKPGKQVQKLKSPVILVFSGRCKLPAEEVTPLTLALRVGGEVRSSAWKEDNLQALALLS